MWSQQAHPLFINYAIFITDKCNMMCVCGSCSLAIQEVYWVWYNMYVYMYMNYMIVQELHQITSSKYYNYSYFWGLL